MSEIPEDEYGRSYYLDIYGEPIYVQTQDALDTIDGGGFSDPSLATGQRMYTQGGSQLGSMGGGWYQPTTGTQDQYYGQNGYTQNESAQVAQLPASIEEPAPRITSTVAEEGLDPLTNPYDFGQFYSQPLEFNSSIHQGPSRDINPALYKPDTGQTLENYYTRSRRPVEYSPQDIAQNSIPGSVVCDLLILQVTTASLR